MTAPNPDQQYRPTTPLELPDEDSLPGLVAQLRIVIALEQWDEARQVIHKIGIKIRDMGKERR